MKDITISRRSLLVSAGLLALAPLAGCGGNSGSGSAAAGSDYTIGVLQLTEHSALDAANDGFVKAIKESGLKVKIDQKNAQNDQSTCKSIADKFVGDGVDLIYAIATPAAQGENSSLSAVRSRRRTSSIRRGTISRSVTRGTSTSRTGLCAHQPFFHATVNTPERIARA